eukprot:scaffold6103_cov116-Cylindrotheca_fusiformis.AAC.5
MMPITMLILLILVLASFAIATQASNGVSIRGTRQLQDTQTALNRARSLWESHDTDEYSYHVRSKNVFYDVTFVSFVEQDEVTKMTTNLVAEGYETLQNIRPPTVNAFFDRIQKAINDLKKKPTVLVTYDQTYGYPLNVSLDYGNSSQGFFFLTDTIAATIEGFVPVSQEMAKLKKARQDWRQFSFQNYDTVYEDNEDRYLVEVRDDTVVKVVDSNSLDVTNDFPPGSLQADQFLVHKQQAAMEEILTTTYPNKLEVSYNPDNKGYITSADVVYGNSFMENNGNITYSNLQLSEVGTQSPISPTSAPSDLPTMRPSMRPSTSPSMIPSSSPSQIPTALPSVSPTESQVPSPSPSKTPSKNPTPSPSTTPSIALSDAPTASASPTTNKTEPICVPRFQPCTAGGSPCCRQRDSCSLGGRCRPLSATQKTGREKLSGDRSINIQGLNRRRLHVRGA